MRILPTTNNNLHLGSAMSNTLALLCELCVYFDVPDLSDDSARSRTRRMMLLMCKAHVPDTASVSIASLDLLLLPSAPPTGYPPPFKVPVTLIGENNLNFPNS